MSLNKQHQEVYKMNSIKNTLKLSTMALGLMITFAACSAVNNDVESLSDADIEVATVILTESTADETSGVMSGMYDAFSSVGSDGISYGDGQTQMKGMGDDHQHRGGRSDESNFNYSYDPETGTHTLSFDRSVSGDFGSKSVSLLNTYIFTSPDGEWIVYPRAHRDSIETIDFTRNVNGEVDGMFRQSEFTRIDTFSVTGLHATSTVLGINGGHQSFGEASGMLDDGETQASRAYELLIDLENVEINKDSVATYGNLEQGVTGTLSYKLYISRTVGDRSDEKSVEGTIEFTGDGTALLRFKGIPKTVRFSLRDGSRDGQD